MKKLLIFLLAAGVLTGCTPKKWVLTDSSAMAIPIDKSTDAIADPEMTAYLTPIKEMLDKEMNQVIAQTSERMERGFPESLLSNWNADVYLKAAGEYLKEPVDLAVVNMGSLRAPLPKGDITVGDIFRLMPFENELVILYLKGSAVRELFEIFANENGQGIAGAQIEIKDRKVADCSIQGKAIEDDKIYSIATNDFLAGGNDRMIPLASPVKRVDTKLKVRNILMAEVVRAGQEGRPVQSQLDGRIRIK